jgi:TonB family protein
MFAKQDRHGLACSRSRAKSLVLGLLLLLLSLVVSPRLSSQAPDAKDRKLITRIEPDYPETLRRLYIGGTVRLEVVVTPQGAVKNVTLLGGSPILGQAAMTAVKKWKYAPASETSTSQVSIQFDPHR